MGKKVFIDCGGYTGDTVKLFREKFPNADSYEIHCFEPNPSLFQYYKDLGVNFYPKAVWIHDESVKFFLDDGSLGSSIMRSKKTGRLNKSSPIRVPCVCLSSWIDKNFNSDDEVILKLDVEGAEYEILKKMCDCGTIDKVKMLYVEWHGHKMKMNKKDHDRLVKRLESVASVSPNVFKGFVPEKLKK